jgi:hypothetical protein
MFTMNLQGLERFAPLAKVKTRYTPSRFTLDGYREHPWLQITGRWFAQPSDLVDTMINHLARTGSSVAGLTQDVAAPGSLRRH